jgi:hypothetical protein
MLHAPLYARLAEGVGADAQLRAFAETRLPGQPAANILFAAVHYLLLRGDTHPLRDFYPNLNDGCAVGEGDPFAAFHDFVTASRVRLAPLVTTRITNTNEVARSALLHPGFRVLAAQTGEPLHLIELGPSAALNLNWDRYHVLYRRGDESFATDAPTDALTLDTALRGDGVPPLGPPPAVASRVGLERAPVDLADPDARDWLRALVWPDHVGRFARLEQAIALARVHPPPILAGDGVELLIDTLARLPPAGTVCLYHTQVTYQFSPAMREALDALLVVAGLRRQVFRLSVEWDRDGNYPLKLTGYRDGVKTETTLALCDPHGAWMEWFGLAGRPA